MTAEHLDQRPILIVEDNPADVDVLLEQLAGAGFAVAVAQDGERALERSQSKPPDLILLDVGLPGIDGFETCRRLKAHPATQDIPVIFMTALTNPADMLTGFAVGGVDYITKPFRHKEVVARVTTHLRLRELTRQLQEINASLAERVAERTAMLETANQELQAEIAEHRRTEAALRASEERYRALYDDTPSMYFTVDPVGTVVSVNQFGAAYLGYAPEELIGQSVLQVFVDDDQAPALAHLATCLAQPGQVFRWELRKVRKDGALLWVKEAARAVRGSDGAPMVLIVCEDITERKRAEAALAAERNLLRTLIDNLPDYIYVKDTASRFVMGNIAVARLMGAATPDDLVGKTDFDCYPAELARGYYADDQALIQSGQPLIDREEPVIDQHTGHQGWLSTTKVPLRDGRGQIVGLVGMGRDITERRSLEAQLRQAQKMEAIGRLAGGIAHDFNNLLTAILGYTELVLAELAADAPLRQEIQGIQTAGVRAAALTRQLLTFSRQQVLQPELLNLNTVIANLSQLLHRVLGEDIELVTILSPELGWVKTDPNQLEQVILNLAINARDAMPEGGKLTIETANVELDATYAQHHIGVSPGAYVMLAISDTGHGMDAATQARIFEPFYTTKEAGKGTGLGLATVHGIVNQSGGHIWVYSELGHGTTFKIYLPQAEAHEPPARPRAAVATPPHGSEIILLVEDEALVRRLAYTVLQKYGYTVLEASTGLEALQLAQVYPGAIDLLITDVILPGGLNGPHVVEQLIAQRPRLKVLYMSGYTDNTILHHGVLDAGLAFLQKPFTPETLARKVRELLDTPD